MATDRSGDARSAAVPHPPALAAPAPEPISPPSTAAVQPPPAAATAAGAPVGARAIAPVSEADARFLAQQYGLPLVGSVNELGALRKCPEWHVTPVAVYAGCDAEVVEALNGYRAMKAPAKALALFELGAKPDQGLEPLFAEALRSDPSPEVRAAAAAALTAAEGHGEIDALVGALADADALVREEARSSLSMIRNGYARRQLLDLRAGTTDPAILAIIDQILEQSYDEPLGSLDGAGL
ncbi:MAG: HEAT repeat domain-containing protein [Candidatus Sumerlaeia bacterium]|nr:HEAT repeat domain-containing protein [Candidatus Sumerlaeia bacterium]